MSLWSPLLRLPAAETTTTFRAGSASTMALTFWNCSAPATEEPPNFATFTMAQSSTAAKNREAPSPRSRAASSCMALTDMGLVISSLTPSDSL